jgi:hypothetical protein
MRGHRRIGRIAASRIAAAPLAGLAARHRRRALVLAAAGALLAAVAGAQSAPAASGGGGATSSADPSLYVVVGEAAPLAAYGGGIVGLAPTDPTVTGARRLNPSSAAGRAYLSFLAGQRR